MTVLSACIRWFLVSLLLTLAIPLSGNSSFAETKEVEVTLTVSVGEWKVARLKSLPTGVGIRTEITCSAPVALLLVDQAGYSAFPDLVAPPLFRSRVVASLSFSVKIPHSDNYYLVVDNRAGTVESSVQLRIEASNDSTAASPNLKPSGPLLTDLSKKLEQFVAKMQQIFVFRKFRIVTSDCRKKAPAGNGTKIPLCVDRAQQLNKKTGSREKATDVLVFSLFHEIGHLLLEQWEYPFAKNGEIADEFAGFLLAIMRQEHRLDAVAEYLLTGPEADEMIDSLFMDTRHQDFVRRPHVILSYKNNLEKKRRWLKFLIQHLQTSMLDKLLEMPSPGIDPGSVRKEMLRRGMKS
jgi:hypothetical protein